MTCLDNEINFLASHTQAQTHRDTIAHRDTNTDTGDHYIWQVAGEFTLVNRHYCEMAVYWIIITLSALNIVSVLSVCRSVCACVCVRVGMCVRLAVCVCGCCWQVRDRRGLARLNYVYDYILLQKHTHTHTHTRSVTQCVHTHLQLP